MDRARSQYTYVVFYLQGESAAVHNDIIAVPPARVAPGHCARTSAGGPALVHSHPITRTESGQRVETGASCGGKISKLPSRGSAQ